jgi:hypothetical protein
LSSNGGHLLVAAALGGTGLGGEGGKADELEVVGGNIAGDRVAGRLALIEAVGQVGGRLDGRLLCLLGDEGRPDLRLHRVVVLRGIRGDRDALGGGRLRETGRVRVEIGADLLVRGRLLGDVLGLGEGDDVHGYPGGDRVPECVVREKLRELGVGDRRVGLERGVVRRDG